MAEKYGTIPKKYTKEWWDYFWTYYKWYVIGIIALILLTCFTIYQKATTPKYDITVTYVGEQGFSGEQADLIKKNGSPLCPDIDENGKKSLEFRQLNLPKGDPQYSSTMLQKFHLSLSEDDVYLYICESAVVDPYIEDSPEESNFIPLDDWCSKKTDPEKTYSKNGTSYGIELTECEFFQKIAKETNDDFSGMYLFVRYYPRKDQIKKQLEGYNAAKKLAEQIVTGK